MDNKAELPDFCGLDSKLNNILHGLNDLLASSPGGHAPESKPPCKPLDSDAKAKLQADLERSLAATSSASSECDYHDVLGALTDAQIIGLVGDGINRPDQLGDTLLSAVAETDRVELCEALLAKGADPDIANGYDAMEVCIFDSKGKNAVRILDRMLEHSRYGIHDQHAMGMTLLHTAVLEHRWDVIEYLVGQGTELSDMDIDCETEAEYARQEGGETYLDQLLAIVAKTKGART